MGNWKQDASRYIDNPPPVPVREQLSRQGWALVGVIGNGGRALRRASPWLTMVFVAPLAGFFFGLVGFLAVSVVAVVLGGIHDAKCW